MPERFEFRLPATARSLLEFTDVGLHIVDRAGDGREVIMATFDHATAARWRSILAQSRVAFQEAERLRLDR